MLDPFSSLRSAPRSYRSPHDGGGSVGGGPPSTRKMESPEHPHRWRINPEELLAEFFLGNLTEEQQADLAGSLVFRSHPRGASLYSASLLGMITPAERLELMAIARFPFHEKAAKSCYEVLRVVREPQEEEGSRLTVSRYAALYAARCHQLDNEAIGQLTREVIGRFEGFDAKSRAEQCQVLVDFVRRSLDDLFQVSSRWRTPLTYGVPALAELSSLSSLPESTVQSLLCDQMHGLTEEEFIRWKYKSAGAQYEIENPMYFRILEGIRDFVAIENRLYRAGLRESLTGERAICELIQGGVYKFDIDFRLLPRGAYHLRAKHFSGSAEDSMAVKRVNMREALNRRLKLSHKPPSQPVEESKATFSDLAKQFALVTPIPLHQLGLKILGTKNLERIERDTARSESVRFLDSPTTYLQLALQSYKAGEITHIPTPHELSRLHFTRYSPSDIESIIYDQNYGLPESVLEALEFQWRFQPEEDPLAETSTTLRTSPIIDKVAKAFFRRINEEKKRNGNLQPVTRTSNRGSFQFMEHRFDSGEEAATAWMFQMYVEGFELVEGKTYQVKNQQYDHDFVIDLNIDGEPLRFVVEYHRIRSDAAYGDKQGDIPSRSAERRYRRRLEEFPGDKGRFVEAATHRFGELYRQKRLEIVEASPRLRGSTVVHIENPEELYYFLLKTLHCTGLPDRKTFLTDFERIRKIVNDLRTVNGGGNNAQRSEGESGTHLERTGT